MVSNENYLLVGGEQYQRRCVMQEWIDNELQTSDLGDSRLDNRFKLLTDRLSQHPSESIPSACNDWNETLAVYRFFDNERVDEKGVLKPHYNSTLKRIQEHDIVLLAQDTTELEVTRPNQQMVGAGPLNNETRLGFFNHATIALTPERVPLGVIESNIWARDMDEFMDKKKNKKTKEIIKKQKPIEKKESFRWVKAYHKACEIQAQSPNTTIITLSDSESDIYELLTESVSEKIPKKAELIVRACQNRSLTEISEFGKGYKKLWDEVSSAKFFGNFEVRISKNEAQTGDKRKRKQARSARTTTVAIRARKVNLKAPYRKGKKLPDIEINAILVKETAPPEDELAIEWLLLTTLPINSLKKVRRVIEYYCCRWEIEIYFKVLKSGCKVEKRHFETVTRFKPCLAFYMILAWRVMYMMMLGRKCPDMPCDAVLTEDEWKSVYVVIRGKEPEKVPTLKEMIYIIASLGGHLGRKNDGPPGPKTMWIGMQRMADFARAWCAFRNI